MTLTIQATYTGGVLRPNQPLALAEGETVELTIAHVRAPSESCAADDAVVRRIDGCKSYHEWLDVMKTLPSDDGGYDIVEALAENRRWSGERPLVTEKDCTP